MNSIIAFSLLFQVETFLHNASIVTYPSSFTRSLIIRCKSFCLQLNPISLIKSSNSSGSQYILLLFQKSWIEILWNWTYRSSFLSGSLIWMLWALIRKYLRSLWLLFLLKLLFYFLKSCLFLDMLILVWFFIFLITIIDFFSEVLI